MTDGSSFFYIKPTNNDTTTSKFASLNLQFGRNYDPKSK